MAGKLRYLDSRKDEQLRGITMKSSCISLIHSYGESVVAEDCDQFPQYLVTVESDNYLINLIDSPGHVDFSGEVSAAVRLCDGCLILVDVVEGVCPQTQTALRQAWLEGLKPVLVLNKIDRLVLEVKLSPLDSYLHMLQIVEQVNAIMGELFMGEVLQESSKESSQPSSNANKNADTSEEYTYDWSSGIDDKDDSNLYFSPELGNVVFTSATDGWGFTVHTFAALLSRKLKMSEQVLNKTLWGDFYVDSKRKSIMKGAQAKAKSPLFVQMVLENIWSAYEAVAVRRDKPAIEKIVSSLNLNVNPRDLNHVDVRVQKQAIFGAWLPLADAILGVVCKRVPSPLQLEESRVERLLCSNLKSFDLLPPETQALKQQFLNCSSASAATKIVCISKMVCVDKKFLPENKAKVLTHEEIMQRREQAKQRLAAKQQSAHESGGAAAESEVIGETTNENEKDEHFIAFARIFSGSLRQGDQVYVMVSRVYFLRESLTVSYS